MRKFRNFRKKYCYIIWPLAVILILIGLDFFFGLSIKLNENLASYMFGGAISILGFLLASIAILAGLNKDSLFMILFVKTGHQKIFYRSIIICGISCIVLLVLSIFDFASPFLLMLTFSVVIIELCIVSNLIIKTSIGSSKN